LCNKETDNKQQRSRKIEYALVVAWLFHSSLLKPNDKKDLLETAFRKDFAVFGD